MHKLVKRLLKNNNNSSELYKLFLIFYKMQTHQISNIFFRHCTPCFHLFALQSVDHETHVCLPLANDVRRVDEIDEWAGERSFCPGKQHKDHLVHENKSCK